MKSIVNYSRTLWIKFILKPHCLDSLPGFSSIYKTKQVIVVGSLSFPRNGDIFLRKTIDKRRANQLLQFDRNVISTTVALFTGHWVMGRHAGKLQLPSNGFCQGCGSVKDLETVIHVLCQWPSLPSCRFMFFDSLFLVSITEISAIVI